MIFFIFGNILYSIKDGAFKAQTTNAYVEFRFILQIV